MKKARRGQVPAFGEWNYHCDDWPITQYFDSAMHAGLIRASPPPPHKSLKKVMSRRDNGTTPDRQHRVEQHGRKQSRVADARAQSASKDCRVVKAVDEDLYKIPHEDILSQKTGRKGMMRRLLMGCLELNCIA